MRAILWTLPLAAAVAAAIALPVGGQEADAPAALAPPRSLLPEGTDQAPPAPVPEGQAPPSEGSGPSIDARPAVPSLFPGGAAQEQQPDAFASEASAREITVAGPLGGNVTGPGGGYGMNSFAGSNGRFLYGLLRRMSLPVASRWAHITLRRALLTESVAPPGISPADWIAARASALVRMGEIDGAKMLVDAVPLDRYSRALYQVAATTAFAAADLGGVCPLAVTGQALSTDPQWRLAVAICGAMEGDDLTAARVFDELRKDGKHVDPFDIRLGERVAAIAGGGGRATNIPWDEAPVLTPYRWGVATAAGLAVPPDKLAALGPARWGWLVRAAAVAPEVRATGLRPAAAIGVMSGDELVSAISAGGLSDDASTPAGQLRAAFAGGSDGDRVAAIRAIWANSGDDPVLRYAALIETAPAALRLAPSSGNAADAGTIVAALLAVGAEAAAAKWRGPSESAGSANRAKVWSLLVAGTPGGPVDAAAFRDWRSNAAAGATPHRAALLAAALTGMGRAPGGGWDALRRDLVPDAPDSWTRAIDAAAAGGRVGEVAILAGTGLQGRWADVAPGHFRHLIAALVRVGRGHEARMIAAEAVTRA